MLLIFYKDFRPSIFFQYFQRFGTQNFTENRKFQNHFCSKFIFIVKLKNQNQNDNCWRFLELLLDFHSQLMHIIVLSDRF